MDVFYHKMMARGRWYTEHYAPSQKQLGIFLGRYIHKHRQDIDARKQALAWVAPIVEKIFDQNNIDNDKLAVAYEDQFDHRGLSYRKINEKLKLKGFDHKAEWNEDREREKAYNFIRKKKFESLETSKIIQKMINAGFSFDLVREIVEEWETGKDHERSSI